MNPRCKKCSRLNGRLFIRQKYTTVLFILNLTRFICHLNVKTRISILKPSKPDDMMTLRRIARCFCGFNKGWCPLRSVIRIYYFTCLSPVSVFFCKKYFTSLHFVNSTASAFVKHLDYYNFAQMVLHVSYVKACT